MSYMIQEEVELVVRSMGYHLVEFSTGNSRKTVFVILYVYRNAETGITSEDCDQIVLALKPRVTSLVYPQYLSLSVSSPGLNRVFKNRAEYPVFVGRKVRISLSTGNTVEGLLLEANEHKCIVDASTYTYDQIIKGRLLDCI